ncbi:MAG: winged helix-turn-helix domain-containing protein [Crocinitomicaceae bacterium]|nr:winged helix-turn-helix domain-containing protein [Crocinitomicaceae bacterium]
MILRSKYESTELSGKETELLLLLYHNENKILEREYILNQVWQDTGEYVGRTLDVFISKLRKKWNQMLI